LCLDAESKQYCECGAANLFQHKNSRFHKDAALAEIPHETEKFFYHRSMKRIQRENVFPLLYICTAKKNLLWRSLTGYE
jgi:hypothetical protein